MQDEIPNLSHIAKENGNHYDRIMTVMDKLHFKAK